MKYPQNWKSKTTGLMVAVVNVTGKHFIYYLPENRGPSLTLKDIFARSMVKV